MQDLTIYYAPYIRLSSLFQGGYKDEALAFFYNNVEEWTWGDTCHTLVLKQYFAKEIENLRTCCPPELVLEYDFILVSLLNVGPGVCIDLES